MVMVPPLVMLLVYEQASDPLTARRDLFWTPFNTVQRFMRPTGMVAETLVLDPVDDPPMLPPEAPVVMFPDVTCPCPLTTGA